MSFASEVRQELCALEQADCCRHAAIYGLLLFGHHFSDRMILFQTEREKTAYYAAELLAAETGIFAEIRSPLKRGGRIYSVTVPEEACAEVLRCFGHRVDEPNRRIHTENLRGDCCSAAFLRGVFLACGTISDPLKQYHFEFSVSRVHLFRELKTFVAQLPIGVHFGTAERKNTHILYCKASEEITDLLTYLGAVNASMKLMQVKMLKEVRNTANRLRNLDTANIDKTVSASAQQLAAIRKLHESGRMKTLPEQLRELAQLREENPEMSLRELGERLSVPLSRSGVNHRLERLIQLAEEKTIASVKTKEKDRRVP